MSKEALVVLNRKRGAVKAQLTRIKDFMNNLDEKDKTHLESKLDTLKSLRIKLSDIRNEYYKVVADDSDLEPLESEILDLEDDCEDIYIHCWTIAKDGSQIAMQLNIKRDMRPSRIKYSCHTVQTLE
ncbi:hypothetical protein TNCV_769291 [Trichonephila clavipes]|nr:hypothetical protein TNCV_769291 [Trichonephila clavipes]